MVRAMIAIAVLTGSTLAQGTFTHSGSLTAAGGASYGVALVITERYVSDPGGGYFTAKLTLAVTCADGSTHTFSNEQRARKRRSDRAYLWQTFWLCGEAIDLSTWVSPTSPGGAHTLGEVVGGTPVVLL